MDFHMIVLRKSFYIRWSVGRFPRVHEVNSSRDPSLTAITSNPIVTKRVFPQLRTNKKNCSCLKPTHAHFISICIPLSASISFAFDFRCDFFTSILYPHLLQITLAISLFGFVSY